MKIVIGPFPYDEDGWPVRECETLGAAGFDVVPFGDPVESISLRKDADVLIGWSQEYADNELPMGNYFGFKVCFWGDGHIAVPANLGQWDLIATDWRGTKRLREMGVPEERILWWRGFAHDPELHVLPPSDSVRDLDIAFMGRPNPERHALLEQVEAWAQKTSRQTHLVTTPYKRGDEVPIYQRAKIVLGDAIRGEIQMRAGEGMACGALYICGMDTDEIWHSKAPIPTYQRAHLESFLESWLDDEPARLAMVAKQAEWLKTERPVDHLKKLCIEIRRRMEAGGWKDGVAVGNSVTPDVGSTSLRGDHPGGVDDPGAGARVAYEPPLNEQRVELVALVPKPASFVLDLGCACGGVGWRIRHEQTVSVHLAGVDSDARGLARAKDLYGYDETYQANLDEEWTGFWAKQRYDVILAADILEHLRNPFQALHQCRKLLLPGGVVVASLPNIRNAANLFSLVRDGEWRYHVHGKDVWRGPHDNVLSWDHIRFFTKQSIAELFDHAGFEITQWSASLLGWPDGQAWHDAVAHLIAVFGGDADAWKRDEAMVIQHLICAKVRL